MLLAEQHTRKKAAPLLLFCVTLSSGCTNKIDVPPWRVQLPGSYLCSWKVADGLTPRMPAIEVWCQDRKANGAEVITATFFSGNREQLVAFEKEVGEEVYDSCLELLTLSSAVLEETNTVLTRAGEQATWCRYSDSGSPDFVTDVAVFWSSDGILKIVIAGNRRDAKMFFAFLDRIERQKI